MKRFISIGVGIIAILSFIGSFGTESFGQCDPCPSIARLCQPAGGNKGGWFLNGHIESGIWANEYGAKNHYYSKTTSQSDLDYGNGGDTFGTGRPLQNVANSGLQLNQLYLSMGKAVNGECGLDVGGTVDFAFGTDAYLVQSYGLEHSAGHGDSHWGTGDYYSAIAQMYVEFEYKKWNLKAGKFYGPFGSQSFKSTNNFFYSFASDYSIVPHTAGGVYATYTANDKWQFYGGWVQPDSFGETKDDNAFLFGAIWSPTKNLTLHYALGVGENHYQFRNYDYFVNSFVATWQINKCWKYVFDWTYFQTKTVGDTNSIYGFNNELIYTLNSKWAFGVRFGTLRGGGTEYWVPLNDNEDWYTVGLGANWTPLKWLVVKPEIRYDRFSDGSRFGKWTYHGFEHKDQLSGGVAVLVKF